MEKKVVFRPPFLARDREFGLHIIAHGFIIRVFTVVGSFAPVGDIPVFPLLPPT